MSDYRICPWHLLNPPEYVLRPWDSPGHSKGSIGILTAAGFFWGDLLQNTDKSGLNTIMDDVAAAKASIEKLRSLGICIPDTAGHSHWRRFQWTATMQYGSVVVTDQLGGAR